MAILLRDVVPWGRSHEEHLTMFDLGEADLRKRIPGCGDGPAAFNAGMRARGRRVLSADPLYAFTAPAIDARIQATLNDVIEQTRRNAGRFVWEAIPSLEALGERRMAAMRQFLKDYAEGGRPAEAALPGSGLRPGPVFPFSFSLREPPRPGLSSGRPGGAAPGCGRGSGFSPAQPGR